MKLSRQYFLEKKPAEPQRTRYIARLQSYHGNTLGALSMSGHKARRAMYEPMLLGNVTHVSPCFPYRNRFNGETDEAYVERLAAELDREFQRVGPETVCAFIAEPVVGAVSVSTSILQDNTLTRNVVGARLCSPCTWIHEGNEGCMRQAWRTSGSG